MLWTTMWVSSRTSLTSCAGIVPPSSLPMIHFYFGFFFPCRINQTIFLPPSLLLRGSIFVFGSKKMHTGGSFFGGERLAFAVFHVRESLPAVGSDKYRIGYGSENDWNVVSCLRELRRQKESTVLVTCNPQSVATGASQR